MSANGIKTDQLERRLLPPLVHIVADKGWAALSLKELWDYREVVFFLAWRDIQVRYKQTVLGAAWAIIQPFMSMVIFSIIFGRIAKMPSDGIPYPIFAFAALVPWMFFSDSVGKASNSLVGSAGIMTRIYFPRLAMPISATLGNFVDFGLAFLVLLGMMVYFGVAPTANVVWLPLLLLLGSCDRARCFVRSRGAERAVPRRQIRGAVHAAVVDVRNARRLSGEPHPGSVLAGGVRTQPDGRRDRGIPLGAPRNRYGAGPFDHRVVRSSRRVCWLAARFTSNAWNARSRT